MVLFAALLSLGSLAVVFVGLAVILIRQTQKKSRRRKGSTAPRKDR